MLPGRAKLLSFTLLGALFVASCQKKSHEVLNPDAVSGLKAYSEDVGAGTLELYQFQESLSNLQTSDGTSSEHCLRTLRDNVSSRNKFLNCLSLRGLSGLNQDFLEHLVGVRLERIHLVHDFEAARTLKLLNWIFDISLEQYSLSNPKSNWLEKDALGVWRFTNKEQKTHDDFDFKEGDVHVSISTNELSTLIPHYSYKQRRLTHSMIYRGARGHRKPHFIESEFEEGVRYKYRDVFRNNDNYYEALVLRYVDPALSENDLTELRRNAADYAASQLGVKYGFAQDPNDGYACHLLTGLSYVNAALNFGLSKQRQKKFAFDDLKSVLTEGLSPMREGLSRKYALKFGMADTIKEFPTAGDFLTSHRFEPVAIFVRPENAKKFSDLYSVAEAFVDALDRGATVQMTDEQMEKVEPLLRDRNKLSELIGMARKLKRHTLFRESMQKANVSVERVQDMTVQELKDVLDRLDAERKVLIKAARDEIGLNLMPNAFGKAVDLETKELTNKTEKFSLGDFLLRIQRVREEKVKEFNSYVHSVKIADAEDKDLVEKLKDLQDYLDVVVANMATRRFAVAKVTDEEFEGMRSRTVKVDFRRIDTKSDHKIIDKLINRVIVGFDEKDFDQLQLFIDNLDFEDFKDIFNFDAAPTYTTPYLPSRPAMDPNWSPTTYSNKSYFMGQLPVFGDAMKNIQKALDEKSLSDVELKELEGYLRVYARFLMSVPSLKKKLSEYDNRQDELQDVIKNSPYIASELSNETLIEFGLYKKIASGVSEGLDTVREKSGEEQLWQMPPWIQRSWIEFLFDTKVSVLRYVP
ncbi:MAG: hypothetical protein R3A80_08515 [Bdellovibrionota bacterium]